jgi:hypothetical protein
VTERLGTLAKGVLRAGWREGSRPDGTPFGFTCPAPRRYPHQWYWGLVPHTVFWTGRARWRRASFYATASGFGSFATAHTQTPMLALAWELVADGDREFELEGLGPLAPHYDWLERDRDPDGDGLVAILPPDESGLDDSPKYDQVYRRMAHYRPDVLVNTVYALSLRALHRMSGEPRFLRRAERAEAALMERCWDERRGLFFDLATRSERRVEVSTWSSLAPLALRALPEDVRRRLVEEHLLDPRRYRAPVGIPSVSMEEPSFRAGFGPSWATRRRRIGSSTRSPTRSSGRAFASTTTP